MGPTGNTRSQAASNARVAKALHAHQNRASGR